MPADHNPHPILATAEFAGSFLVSDVRDVIAEDIGRAVVVDTNTVVEATTEVRSRTGDGKGEDRNVLRARNAEDCEKAIVGRVWYHDHGCLDNRCPLLCGA